MKSKVKAFRKKDGGWNIKFRATDHKEVLSFFAIGFSGFLESLDKQNRKIAKNVMMTFLKNEFREEDNHVQKNND